MPELLITLAIGAMVIGAAAIGFGAIARFTGATMDVTNVTLDTTKVLNYYNRNTAIVKVPVAPNFGATLAAEDLRERFLADTQKATAVFCLARGDVNTYRPQRIPFLPDGDPYPDTSEKFRLLLIRKLQVTSAVYSTVQRPYNDTVRNASIFVLGYSDDPFYLKVNAIYDIDVVQTNTPQGFYASVKRYVNLSGTADLTAYYDVFYPGYNGTGLDGLAATWPATTDNFSPVWVSFERLARGDNSPPESATIERFKRARERPFYLMWWPDPNAKTLGLYRASDSSYAATDPRRAYNHMAGRTSFMFCVPQFPTL